MQFLKKAFKPDYSVWKNDQQLCLPCSTARKTLAFCFFLKPPLPYKFSGFLRWLHPIGAMVVLLWAGPPSCCPNRVFHMPL